MGPSTCFLPHDDTTGVGLYIPLQSVPVLCNTCTGLIIVGRLEPSILLSGLSQPLMMKFEEWWT